MLVPCTNNYCKNFCSNSSFSPSAVTNYKVYVHTMDTNTVKDLLSHKSLEDLKSLSMFVESLKGLKVIDAISMQLIDVKVLEEVQDLCNMGEVIYFGKTLKDMKYIYQPGQVSKPLEVFITYKSLNKFIITEVSLPHSSIQDIEYNSLIDLISLFKSQVDSLSTYLQELENIDKYCSVIEPANPSFKDDYRRLLLDKRTWLHVEVNQAGLASNLHLLGQTDHWQEQLQEGLLNWDHDKDIVENIMTIFALTEFPSISDTSITLAAGEGEHNLPVATCSICMCEKLPDDRSLPQPLCSNPSCGVNYHRNCLFQWLVACAGGKPPTFGVISGSCPTCLEPVTCNEKDN